MHNVRTFNMIGTIVGPEISGWEAETTPEIIEKRAAVHRGCGVPDRFPVVSAFF
jgi:hypothetical protein